MKKQIILLGGILAFLVLATGCLNQNGTRETEITTESQEGFRASTTQEVLDSDILIKAVQYRNKGLCGTIENQEQKNDCEIRVDDKIIMDQAQEEVNINLCENIKNSQTVEQCKAIVKILSDMETKRAEQDKINEEKDKQIKEDGEALLEAVKDGKPTVKNCEVIKDPEFKASCIEFASL